MENKHVLTALVEHKPGVLQRIASMFTRRRFNIESITVGETDNPGIARMTVITRGDDKVLEQILKQMNKLADVIKVTDLERGNSVTRELCLVKINTPDEKHRLQVMQYSDVFRASIVDINPKSLTVEVTGDPNKIDAFIDLAKSFGIKEIARTGVTALVRG